MITSTQRKSFHIHTGINRKPKSKGVNFMTIVDAHVHIGNIKENFKPIYDLAKRLNYSKLTLMSLQCTGNLLQNLTCALCKSLHPKITYAFGGLDYITGRDLLSQVQNLKAFGFDGVKMLEGKPTTRRKLGYALSDPKYYDFFKFSEENSFPVLLHIADPPEFWDKDKVPPWAVEYGWHYDENDVPYSQYYDEIEKVLEKHPKLRAIFAHFYFLSDNPERAQKFLDDHPNIFIDVTAGIEMYENFSKDTAFWREFFIKNEDRIIFGTDSSDAAEDPDDDSDKDEKVDINGYAAMEIEFLKSDKEIKIFDKKIKGIGLPESSQKLIFSENYYSLVGTEPKKLDISALKKEAAFIRDFLQTDEDKETLDYIVSKLN